MFASIRNDTKLPGKCFCKPGPEVTFNRYDEVHDDVVPNSNVTEPWIIGRPKVTPLTASIVIIVCLIIFWPSSVQAPLRLTCQVAALFRSGSILMHETHPFKPLLLLVLLADISDFWEIWKNSLLLRRPSSRSFLACLHNKAEDLLLVFPIIDQLVVISSNEIQAATYIAWLRLVFQFCGAIPCVRAAFDKSPTHQLNMSSGLFALRVLVKIGFFALQVLVTIEMLVFLRHHSGCQAANATVDDFKGCKASVNMRENIAAVLASALFTKLIKLLLHKIDSRCIRQLQLPK